MKLELDEILLTHYGSIEDARPLVRPLRRRSSSHQQSNPR